MKHRLVILGAGGHGKVCSEVASLNNYGEIIFLDDRHVPGMPVIGTMKDIKNCVDDSLFFVSIGNNDLRKNYIEEILSLGGSLVNLIHPNSTVSRSAVLADGIVVMAGAVIQANASIDRGVIVNTCSSVDHDCTIGKYSHIAVGSHLGGTVKVGESSFIGAGSSVSNNVTIADNCIVGVGTAVIHDLDEAGIYVGVPARRV